MTDPTTDPTERIIHAAWHEFRYPRPATDGPTDAFRRAIRVALTEAGAVPGTPAAEAPHKVTAGQLDDVARAVVDEYMHTAPKVIDVLAIAREAAARGAALSPAPVPDDTQRTVLAELAAGMRQIAELVGMDSEAGEVGPVVERVRALVSPAPGNEPDDAEVSAADLAGILTLAADLGTESWHEMAQHLKRRYEIRERAASVAQEGGERG